MWPPTATARVRMMPATAYSHTAPHAAKCRGQETSVMGVVSGMISALFHRSCGRVRGPVVGVDRRQIVFHVTESISHAPSPARTFIGAVALLVLVMVWALVAMALACSAARHQRLCRGDLLWWRAGLGATGDADHQLSGEGRRRRPSALTAAVMAGLSRHPHLAGAYRRSTISCVTPLNGIMPSMPLTPSGSIHEEVSESSIEQIVAMAGDGVLKDNGPCSAELRRILYDNRLSSAYISGIVFAQVIKRRSFRIPSTDW